MSENPGIRCPRFHLRQAGSVCWGYPDQRSQVWLFINNQVYTPGSEAGNPKIKASEEPMPHTASHRGPSVCPQRVEGRSLEPFHGDTNSIHEVPPSELGHSHRSVYVAQAPEAIRVAILSSRSSKSTRLSASHSRPQTPTPCSCLTRQSAVSSPLTLQTPPLTVICWGGEVYKEACSCV